MQSETPRLTVKLAYKTETTVGTSEHLKEATPANNPKCPECKGKGVIELLSSTVPCKCRSDPRRYGPRRYGPSKLAYIFDQPCATREDVIQRKSEEVIAAGTPIKPNNATTYSQARHDLIETIRELELDLARTKGYWYLDHKEDLTKSAQAVCDLRDSIKDYMLKSLVREMRPIAVLNSAMLIKRIDESLKVAASFESVHQNAIAKMERKNFSELLAAVDFGNGPCCIPQPSFNFR